MTLLAALFLAASLSVMTGLVLLILDVWTQWDCAHAAVRMIATGMLLAGVGVVALLTVFVVVPR